VEPIIELRGLTKRFGDLMAVDGIDLTVYKGDIYGFLGPNGAGKSTTIRMMLSLIRPTSGSITLFGKPLSSDRNNILRRIGAIVERPDFYNYLTAYKNLDLLGRISGADVSKANLMKVLDLVGLDNRAHSKVKTFSHGMKQRLGIAQSLLHDPDLIILDEPTTGLDPHGMVDVRSIILRLIQDHSKTIVLSSHILPEVELTATRMVIINKGKVVVEGAVQELLNAGRLRVTIETRTVDVAVNILQQSAWADRIQSSGGTAVILSLGRDEVHEVTAHLINNGLIVDGVQPARSLEEFFITKTRQAS
jgi:ABC-type multidrug transport system ATPase subunit